MFLEDYLNAEERELRENTALITLPTGYGKTYIANNLLIDYYEQKTNEDINYELLLVPTLSIKEQILNDYPQTKRFCSYQLLIEGSTEKSVYVACFQQLVCWLRDRNPIRNIPKLTVIDEVHQIANWANNFDDVLLVFEWLKNNRDKTFLCGLTATPEYLNYVNRAFNELDLQGFSFKDITKPQPIKNTTNRIEIWPNTRLTTVLNTIEPSATNKVFSFTESAKECFDLAQRYNAGFLISKYNKEITKDGKTKLNEAMENQTVANVPFGETNLRQYLLENQRYPQEYNLVIANTAYNCGVNIADEALKEIVVYSNDLATIQQAIGRARHKTERVIICYTNYRSETQETNKNRIEAAIENRQNQSYLRGMFDEQQRQRFEELRTDGKTAIDIVVCKWGNKYEINPFALAAY